MAQDQDSQGLYSIRNKRGGATLVAPSPSGTPVGLDYSNIEYSGSVEGPKVDRSMDPIALKIAATQDSHTFPLLNKNINWGSPIDDGMNFKYSGDRISVPPPSKGGSAKKKAKTLKKKCKKY